MWFHVIRNVTLHFLFALQQAYSVCPVCIDYFDLKRT